VSVVIEGCPGVPWGLAFETWDPSNKSPVEPEMCCSIDRGSLPGLSIFREC
jgi:hypothetical protein